MESGFEALALFALAVLLVYLGAKAAAAAAKTLGVSPLLVSGAASVVAHTIA